MFLKEYEAFLASHNVLFSHKHNHIRCFLHVTNICSSRVIKAFTNVALVDDTGDFVSSTSHPPSKPDRQTYEQAVAHDQVALCQSTICAVHASGGQCDHLAKIIVDGNQQGWFKSAEDLMVTIQVKPLQLVYDMKVQWDSLYYMINWFHKLCLVCVNLIVL